MNNELLSECCGYPQFADSELCSMCLEHANFTNEEDQTT